jgi:hypothetical protein
MKQIVKIQSAWRGYHARLITELLKKAMRVKKKYFLDEEFWETISSSQISHLVLSILENGKVDSDMVKAP